MKEITTTEVLEKLTKGEQLHLLDVRELDEIEDVRISGIQHIPLAEVPHRMNELEKAVPYIIVCRSGGRSGQAATFLEAQGFDVTNMVGGMLDWAGEVESGAIK